MEPAEPIPEYTYRSAEPGCTSRYLWPAVLQEVRRAAGGKPLRILDMGCGNGAFAGRLAREGHQVVGIDASPSGIQQAAQAHPECRFSVASVYSDLQTELGQFDIVVSLEVVEHLYAPRVFARQLRDAVRPGGALLVSTPYHGYLKNIALAIAGRMDAHFGPLWDGGHIKFWSPATLSRLLVEADIEIIRLRGVGRVPLLWKSMLLVGRRASDR